MIAEYPQGRGIRGVDIDAIGAVRGAADISFHVEVGDDHEDNGN